MTTMVFPSSTQGVIVVVIVPLIGAILGVEPNSLWITVKTVSEWDCLLQILSHAHGSYRKNTTKESEVQPSQPLPPISCIVVMLVVVIKAPYLSSLKNRAKQSKLQPSTTVLVAVCRHPLNLIYQISHHKKYTAYNTTLRQPTT